MVVPSSGQPIVIDRMPFSGSKLLYDNRDSILSDFAGSALGVTSSPSDHPSGDDYWYYNDAKQFNANQADLQRRYDEYVRRNSLKWTSDQLKELGINPILAYQYYNSSGAGSSASSISPQAGYARYNAETQSDKVMLQFVASLIAAGAMIFKAFL